MTTSDVMTCFDCEGQGEIRFAFRAETVPCRRCAGTGKCPSLMAEWHTAGQLLKAERINRGVGLREQAKALGITPALLSDIERGMVDPDLKNVAAETRRP